MANTLRFEQALHRPQHFCIARHRLLDGNDVFLAGLLIGLRSQTYHRVVCADQLPPVLGPQSRSTGQHANSASQRGEVKSNERKKGTGMNHHDSIFVTEPDLVRLRDINNNSSLAAELGRAVVLSSRPIPPDLVTMNSSLVFEDQSTGEHREITIVFPQDANVEQGNVSVLAPLGTALLGLSVGQSIVWPFPDGSTRTLRVVRLMYQPEAAEDALRGGWQERVG